MTSPKVDGKLTDLQLSTLIVLWTRPVGPVPNTDLTKVSINLDKKTRDKLAKATLIEVHQERENGPLSVKLTDAGRKRVDEYIDAELPSGTRCGAAALRAVLTVLRPLLNGKASAPPAVPVSATVDADMETRIRKAYATIARRPGARVSLAQLREVLGAADRAEVDNALRQLSRSRDVDIFPDANQKVMTAEERAAALSIGNRDVHIISIGS